MAITGINNSSYTSYYASNYKNTVKKTDSEKDSINTKDGNVTTSTVELKTSRPSVTKTEQIKTGYSNVNDYSKYLQGKYHYMNTGLKETLMRIIHSKSLFYWFILKVFDIRMANNLFVYETVG